MDALSEANHNLLEFFTPQPNDMVFAALLAQQHPAFHAFGIEPVVVTPTTALATAAAPTFLARLGALPAWQRGLLAAGAGLVLVYGLVAIVGVKAAVVGAAAL